MEAPPTDWEWGRALQRLRAVRRAERRRGRPGARGAPGAGPEAGTPAVRAAPTHPPDHRLLCQRIREARGTLATSTPQPAHLLGQVAGALGRVEDLVVKHAEVERQAQADGVGRGQVHQGNVLRGEGRWEEQAATARGDAHRRSRTGRCEEGWQVGDTGALAAVPADPAQAGAGSPMGLEGVGRVTGAMPAPHASGGGTLRAPSAPAMHCTSCPGGIQLPPDPAKLWPILPSSGHASSREVHAPAHPPQPPPVHRQH